MAKLVITIYEKLYFKLTKVKFLQEVITQSDSHEHDYSIALFLPPVEKPRLFLIFHMIHQEFPT